MVGERKVIQMLADYHDFSNGGNGLLRILNFQPGNGLVHVQTYSPYLDEYMKNSESDFIYTMSF